MQEWLPETHLARYLVDVVEALDLSALERAYAAMLLSLLIYGYATGTHSSRRIERATYDSLAFRFIACNQHPDHDTLASFRRRFGEQFADLFVQVLQVARENQLSRFGTVSLDGTKVHANASRHSALSCGHAEKIEAQLKAEVQEMLKLAESADQGNVPEGMDLPAEIKRREDRLAAIAAAKAKIEARAKERFEREQAEYEAKMAKRQAKQTRTGKRPGGKPPKPPQAGPRGEDQINLTDVHRCPPRQRERLRGGVSQVARASVFVGEVDGRTEVLADVVQVTIKQEMRKEADHLRGLRLARERVKGVIEGPDMDMDSIIRAVRENGGKVYNKLVGEFPALVDESLATTVAEAIARTTPGTVD